MCKNITAIRKRTMSNILRLALCGELDDSKDLTGVIKEPLETTSDQESTQTIKMTGPLSEVYTKALQVVYAKPDTTSGLVATESQANDTLMQIALYKAMKVKENIRLKDNLNIIEASNTEEPNVVVHATDPFNLTPASILTTVSDLASVKLSDPETRSILIVEEGDIAPGPYNTKMDKTDTSLVTLRTATENICKSMNVELYYSFEAFVETLQK